MKTIRLIPDAGARIYYRDHALGHIAQHQDETDPHRRDAMIQRGYTDLKWIKNKYQITR